MNGATVEQGKRRLRPRGTFALFAIMGVIALWAAFAGKFQGELLIGVAFVIVIVGDLVGAYHAYGRPFVELAVDGDGVIGSDLSATVVVHGNRQPLWVRVGWWSPRWFTLVAGVPGWVRLRPHARGLIRWFDVDLVGRGPLGLWQVGRRDRIHLLRPVPVAPPSVDHTLTFPPLPVRPFGETDLTRGADDLTRGVREYRPGDARKLVHWPASAHHGRMLVRETETLGTTRVRIAVQTPERGSASEVALGRAHFLVLECLRRGWEVELLTTERVVPPTPTPPGRSAFSSHPTCSLAQEATINGAPAWAYSWPGPPGPTAWPPATWSPAGGPPAYGPPAYVRGPVPPEAPVATTTRRGDVRTVAELAVRLATVAAGPLELPPDRVTTRIVSGGGDEWR